MGPGKNQKRISPAKLESLTSKKDPADEIPVSGREKNWKKTFERKKIRREQGEPVQKAYHRSD